jgi:CRP-like cAMP-binding protein
VCVNDDRSEKTAMEDGAMQLAGQREEMDHAVDLGLLRQAQLFAAMDEATLTRIASVVQVQAFRPGGMISAGEGFLETTFLIAGGRVRSFVSAPSGRIITAHVLVRGEIFMGQASDLLPRSTSAAPMIWPRHRVQVSFQSVTDAVLYRIPNQHLRQILDANPHLMSALFDVFSL